LAGCVTQQDMLEQDRKMLNMIEQQQRSVEAMRKDLEQIRTDVGRGRGGTAPAPRSGATPATRPVPKPAKPKPDDTSKLPGETAPVAGAPAGADIGMTLSPEGVSSEDAPVAETIIAAPGGSSAPAPAAAPAGFVGEAVAATPPPNAAPPAPRAAPVATDPEWRREVAQERAVAKATGGAEQRGYVDALQGLEQGDCKKALARLKAASGGGGSLSDNAMYWQAKCLAARGNQRKATARLNEVVTRYPKSDKAPAALWAQAQMQMNAGDASAAKGTFSKLIKDYPASAEASRAKKKLAEIN
jgi:TolA-binding protein